MLYSPTRQFFVRKSSAPQPLSNRRRSTERHYMYPHLSLYKNSLKSISLLILMVLIGAAIFAPHSTGVSVQRPDIPDSKNPEATQKAFGRLPLSFELNQGQTDPRTKFVARGQGYGIFLTNNGAAFS